MIESPIRRKYTHYPKDFLPASEKQPQQKRFTFNEDYQIEANSIRKYQKSIEEPINEVKQSQQSITHYTNPQKTGPSCLEQEEDLPLEYHLAGKKPSLDQDLLKKPRFSLNDKEEYAEKQDNQLQNSISPGCIKKQLENRQTPLRLQDPCKIELVRSNTNKARKALDSCIKYRSSSEFHNKSWASSEKDIMKKFQGSRSKLEIAELPKLSKHSNNHNEQSFTAAKEQYESFRRKQQSLGGSYGKMNNLLAAIKNRQGSNNHEIVKFQPDSLQRLKEQINSVVRSKKGQTKKEESQQEQSQRSLSSQQSRHSAKQLKQGSARGPYSKLPELLISYRSSLSYLKDLYIKSKHYPSFKLVVKIPKIFIQELIFKDQDRQDLYDSAKNIFEELRIPYENLVIKKYTNCTIMIARNICLIWHYDGRRYLGGWQSEYLDEGFKHGLGLEWEPKKYVYYGEFVRNKKQGLGVYKDRSECNYIGYWARGQKVIPNQSHSSEWIEHNQYQIEGEEPEDIFYARSGRQEYQYL